MAAAGHHVESPGCPATARTVDDMLHHDWADWSRRALDAHDRLAGRADQIVVMGLSMGGTLTSVHRAQPPDGRGHRLRQPGDDAPAGRRRRDAAGDDRRRRRRDAGHRLRHRRPRRRRARLRRHAARAAALARRRRPGPDGRPLRRAAMPLLLFTSRQDHVVEPANSEHLAATYGGEVDTPGSTAATTSPPRTTTATSSTTRARVRRPRHRAGDAAPMMSPASPARRSTRSTSGRSASTSTACASRSASSPRSGCSAAARGARRRHARRRERDRRRARCSPV